MRLLAQTLEAKLGDWGSHQNAVARRRQALAIQADANYVSHGNHGNGQSSEDENVMKHDLAAVCALSLWMSANAGAVQADPEHIGTALAAIESAKAVAKAGRGTLLRVGSILSSDENSSDDDIVVLDDPILRDIKAGMVLILAKQGCEPVDDCLIARRVTDVTEKYGVETEPYGGAEELLLTQIKATLLGSVAYAVDLNTGAIRELRGERDQPITMREALTQEEARTRRAANTGASPGELLAEPSRSVVREQDFEAIR
jgi:hypothetical protein